MADAPKNEIVLTHNAVGENLPTGQAGTNNGGQLPTTAAKKIEAMKIASIKENYTVLFYQWIGRCFTGRNRE